MVNGSSETTTPAACVDACLRSPSSFEEILNSSWICFSLSRMDLNSGSCARASSNVMPRVGGINFATLLTTGNGISITLPTSLTTALAFIVPKVII